MFKKSISVINELNDLILDMDKKLCQIQDELFQLKKLKCTYEKEMEGLSDEIIRLSYNFNKQKIDVCTSHRQRDMARDIAHDLELQNKILLNELEKINDTKLEN